MVVTNTTNSDGTRSSGVSSSQPDQPTILAWFIEQMPPHEPFCPCYQADPSKRNTNFCTAPWTL